MSESFAGQTVEAARRKLTVRFRSGAIETAGTSRWRPITSGIAVFKVAFERWVSESNQRDLPQLMRESLDELKAVTAGA